MRSPSETPTYRPLGAPAFLAALLLLSGGCRSIMNPGPGVVTPSQAYELGNVQGVRLRTSLATAAAGEEAAKQTVASRVHDAVAGKLAVSGFDLAQGPVEVGVRVATETRLFDRSGNFIRYNGTADADLVRLFDQKLLGRERFAAEGPRTLGETEAAEALGKDLGLRVSEWIAATLKPSLVGLSAATLEVRRPLLRGDDAQYVARFVATVSDLPGVVACEHQPNGPQTRSLLFRIVYFPEKFPEGLAVRIVNIKALDLKQ